MNKKLDYSINNNDIKYILKLNSIIIINHKYDDSNIHYVKLYKDNTIINIFKFKSQCANWFVENKILKTYKFAKSRISCCLDKNKDIEGYYVKTSNKEEYDKFN